MRVLILGAGPAGLTAARTLRELAPAKTIDPAITMVSAEASPPYSPPAMADHFLTVGRRPCIGREQTRASACARSIVRALPSRACIPINARCCWRMAATLTMTS